MLHNKEQILELVYKTETLIKVILVTALPSYSS